MHPALQATALHQTEKMDLEGDLENPAARSFSLSPSVAGCFSAVRTTSLCTGRKVQLPGEAPGGRWADAVSSFICHSVYTSKSEKQLAMGTALK